MVSVKAALSHLRGQGVQNSHVSLVRDGQILFSQHHSINNDSNFDYVIPIGSLSEILIGVLVLQAVEQERIKLSEPITKYLPYLSIKEVKFSLHFITIKNLLTHSSGLGQIDRKRSLLEPDKSIWAKKPKFVDQRKLYNRRVETVVHPDLQYIDSIHNYGILSALLEEIHKKSIRHLIEGLLRSIDPSISAFDIDKIIKNTGYENSSSPKHVKPRFTLCYGTRHILLSIPQMIRVFSTIFFSDDILLATSRDILNSSLFEITRDMDEIGISMIYREDQIPLLMKTSIWNGYYVKLVILPHQQTSIYVVSDTLTKDLDKYSNYIINKLIETHLNFMIRPRNAVVDPTKVEELDLVGKYRIAPYSPLLPGVVSQNGLEVLLRRDKKGFFVTDQLAGFFKSNISTPRRLEALSINHDRVILGFWDFLGYQKMIIPSRKDPALIYADIEGPALLFNSNKSARPMRFNLLLHWQSFRNSVFTPHLFKFPGRMKQSGTLITGLFSWFIASISFIVVRIRPRLNVFYSNTRQAMTPVLEAIRVFSKRTRKGIHSFIRNSRIVTGNTLQRFYSWLGPRVQSTLSQSRDGVVSFTHSMRNGAHQFLDQGRRIFDSYHPLVRKRLPLPWSTIEKYLRQIFRDYRRRRRQISQFKQISDRNTSDS